VEWPPIFIEFMNSIAVVNLDVFRTVDLQCEAKAWSFNSTFLLTIFMPIVIAILNFAIMAVRRLVCGSEKAYAQHLKGFLFFLFLIYPNVSSTIMKYYKCTEVGDSFFLDIDARVLCGSDEWMWHAYIGAGAALLYPVGVPVFFLVLLKLNRDSLFKDGDVMEKRDIIEAKVIEMHEEYLDKREKLGLDQKVVLAIGSEDTIADSAGAADDTNASGLPACFKTKEDKKELEELESGAHPKRLQVMDLIVFGEDIDALLVELEEIDDKIAEQEGTQDRLGFIYISYVPAAFYWELVELLKKFILCSVVIFIKPDTLAQVAFAFIVTLMFFLAQISVIPFDVVDDNFYNFISLLSTILTLFCGLVIMGVDATKLAGEATDDPYENYAISLLLVGCNGGVICLFFFAMFGKTQKKGSGDWTANLQKKMQKKMGDASMAILASNDQLIRDMIDSLREGLAEIEGMPENFDKLLEAIKFDLAGAGNKAAKYAGPLGIKKFVNDIQAAVNAPSARKVCMNILGVASGFTSPKVKEVMIQCVVDVVEMASALVEESEEAATAAAENTATKEADEEPYFLFDPIILSLLKSVAKAAVKNVDAMLDTEAMMRGFTSIFEDPLDAPARFLNFTVSILEPQALLYPIAIMTETMSSAADMREHLSAEAIEALELMVAAIKATTIKTVTTAADIKKLVESLVRIPMMAFEDGPGASRRVIVLVATHLQISLPQFKVDDEAPDGMGLELRAMPWCPPALTVVPGGVNLQLID
jgi:hypothetical protein